MWLDEEIEKTEKKKAKKIIAPNSKEADKEADKNEKVPDVTADDFKDTKIKPFFIVLKATGNRKVFMSKQKIGIDRVAKIKTAP